MGIFHVQTGVCFFSLGCGILTRTVFLRISALWGPGWDWSKPAGWHQSSTIKKPACVDCIEALALAKPGNECLGQGMSVAIVRLCPYMPACIENGPLQHLFPQVKSQLIPAPLADALRLATESPLHII